MNEHRAARHAGRRQAGYALLMVVFMASVMLIAVMAAAPRVLTQGQREKEEELVWRGGQYTRAVRMYHRKHGRFPQSLEELSKAKGGLRFLRKPYNDPMNSADGSWRMIYVTPTGQLIGSLRHRNPLQLSGVAGRPAGSPPGAMQRAGPSGTGTGTEAGTGTQGTGQTMSGTTPGTPTSAQPSSQPGTPGGTDTPPEGKVLGGNIIGVGSKINKPSLRIYDGATNYREWEFIWDPAKDVVGTGQPAAPAGNPPGRTPQPHTPLPRKLPQ